MYANTAHMFCGNSGSGDEHAGGWWSSYTAVLSTWMSRLVGGRSSSSSGVTQPLRGTAAEALKEIAGALSTDPVGTNVTRLVAAIADVAKDVSSNLHDLDIKVNNISKAGVEPSSFETHLRLYSSHLPSALEASARSAAELLQSERSASQPLSQQAFVVLP